MIYWPFDWLTVIFLYPTRLVWDSILGVYLLSTGHHHTWRLQKYWRQWRNVASCPAYFSHMEGKNSLVNGLFCLCSMWFKNWWRNVFQSDITQAMKLWNSSKETVCSRDHPSWSFRTPRSEDSLNLKPLSTSESLRRSYRHLKLRDFTLPVGKLRNTYHTRVHESPGIPSLVRSLPPPDLVSCIMLQLPSLHWSPFTIVVTSFSWSNLIGVPPLWRLEQKWNRPLTRLFFPSTCEK